MKGLHVLVVDDEPDLAELVSFEFELLGAKVVTAENGKLAFELCKKINFDVIISDIRMPNGDGFELLKNVRSLSYGKPAIFLMTGYADVTVQEAYDEGANALFGKPFNRKDLIATITRLITPQKVQWHSVSRDTNLFRIEKTLSDINNNNGSFHLGNGGFFLEEKKHWPTLSQVIAFDLKFNSGEIREISGHGIVRWIRTNPDIKNHFPTGMGIEICGLNQSCLNPCLDYIEKVKIPSFIPQR